MTLAWFEVTFPAEVTPEVVAEILATVAAENTTANLPLLTETLITAEHIRWRVGATEVLAERLRLAAEAVLPGMAWDDAEPPDHQGVQRAVELRVRHHDRLLDVNHAEGAVRRLLGLSAELTGGEAITVQWQIGAWLPRPPIPPVSTENRPRSIWDPDQWFHTRRDSEQLAAAKKKTAEAVFGCVGRIAVGGVSQRRAHQLVGATAGAMQLLRAPGVGVSKRVIPSWYLTRRLAVVGVSRRNPPCRLTAAELAGLIGWPIGNPRITGVTYLASRAMPMDQGALRHGPAKPGARVLGESAYPSQHDQLVVLPAHPARRHLHVIGPSGVGKSTMLAHLILAEIAAGRSVIAIDPKGDLVTDVLVRVPREHRDRVVVLDPADPAPVGFNSLGSGVVGIDGVITVLKSVWNNAWGPRLGDVMHGGLTTLAMTPGHSMAELPLLLTDERFRRPLVAAAVKADPLGLGTFWPWFEALSPELRVQVLAPVMSRMRALLRPELRGMLGQAEPRFDLRRVFTERFVVLVRLPKGQLGADGTQLVGSLLVAHLWRLIQARASVPAEKRHTVSLVLDEFQEFLRLDLELGDVLVQARGLGVALHLAHQHLGQLDPGLVRGVLANAGSRVAFRLDYDDARTIAKRTGGVLTPEDFMGLEPFHAYAAVMTDGGPTGYGSMRTRPLGPPITTAAEMLAANRNRYGIDRAQTEAHMIGLIGGSAPSTPGAAIGRRRINRGDP